MNIDEPKNIILYGPLGTGKTYKTVQMAAELITGRPYTSKKYATK